MSEIREMLYRGRRVDNGEWVEGFYVFNFWNKGEHTIHFEESERGCCTVDPATVGRYCPEYEKYEDDVVHYGSHIGYVKYGAYKMHGIDHVGFYIYWLDRYYRADVRKELPYWAKKKDALWKGNIHDQPELLEERK